MKKKIGLFPIVYLLLLFFVLPINFANAAGRAKSHQGAFEYINSVAVETGNIWKRHLVQPLSKVWEPWFAPKTGGGSLYISKNIEKEKNIETSGSRGEVLSVTVAASSQDTYPKITKEEFLNWLKDLFLSQSKVASSQNTTNVYHSSSGVTQGLADSVGRSISEINTSIGGDLDTLEANGVFNTSVLSVDTVNTRVGIGTSTPTDTLSINGPAYFAQTSAPSNTSNRLYNTGGDLYWAGNLIGGAATGNWATDGTSVWRASGSVGVGTTSPFASLSVNNIAGTPGFVVGSSTATSFIVDKNGNVGVGTANPDLPLVIQTATDNRFGFYQSGGANIMVSVNGNDTAVKPLVINTDTFDLQSSGVSGLFMSTNATGRKIGIGTTTPFAKLSVESTAGAAQFVVGSSTATQFIVDKNGNVGVGTVNPTVGGLEINNIGNTFSSIPANTVGLGIISQTGWGGTGFTISNSANNAFSMVHVGSTSYFGRITGSATNHWMRLTDTGLRYGTSGSSAVNRLDIEGGAAFGTYAGTAAPTNGLIVSGNVGIGTTTPTYLLHVVGATGGISGITMQNTTASSYGMINAFNDGGKGLNIYALGSTYGNTFFGGVTGNNQLVLEANSGTSSFYVGTNGSQPIILAPNRTAAVTIINGGNVGIGTTTPWRTLSVNGTVAMPGLVNDSTGYYVCLNTTTGQMATSTTACGASSERFKENITDITYGLNEVLGLRPVSFDYKANYIPNAPKQLGFIAEEVDLLIPELVARNDAGEIQGLDYPKFTALLVRAVQEMNERLDNMALVIQETVDKYLASNEIYIRSVATDGLEVNGTIKVGGDICVEDVCITKEQFKDLILRSGVGAVQKVDNSLQIVDDSGEGGTEEAGETETASSTPETISDTPGENATTTEEVIEEVATTTTEVVE